MQLFESKWFVYAAFAAYILQMTVGAVLFYGNYRDGVAMIKAVDSNNKISLRWLHGGAWYLIIYSVLMAVVSCLPPIVHNIFTILIVIAYIFFAARFTAFVDRYYQELYPVVTEAGLSDNTPAMTSDYLQRESYCRYKVERWVAGKGYTKGDLDREETANEMGLSEEDLRWYFAVCLKEDLRSWRVNLRIELAKEILTSNPDAPINELSKAVGFTSRNNLYTHFKKIYGMTPKEYGMKVQQENS